MYYIDVNGLHSKLNGCDSVHFNNMHTASSIANGRVLASSAGGPGFNSQSRTASYERRYKNATSSALV